MIVGIGFDLVEVGRFRESVSRYGEDFLLQFLTAEELADCASHPRPFPAYASRFAAKEAFSKALGTGVMGSLSWHDISVCRDESGRERFTLHGSAKRGAGALGVDHVHVSLAHEQEMAAAVVLLERVRR